MTPLPAITGRGNRRCGPGQATVEFALVLLVFLALLLGILEGARVAYSAWAVANAARSGARAGLYLPSAALTSAMLDARVRSTSRASLTALGLTIRDEDVVVCRHAAPTAAVDDPCDTSVPPLAQGSVIDVSVRYPGAFSGFVAGWLGQTGRSLSGYHRARLE